MRRLLREPFYTALVSGCLLLCVSSHASAQPNIEAPFQLSVHECADLDQEAFERELKSELGPTMREIPRPLGLRIRCRDDNVQLEAFDLNSVGHVARLIPKPNEDELEGLLAVSMSQLILVSPPDWLRVDPRDEPLLVPEAAPVEDDRWLLGVAGGFLYRTPNSTPWHYGGRIYAGLQIIPKWWALASIGLSGSRASVTGGRYSALLPEIDVGIAFRTFKSKLGVHIALRVGGGYFHARIRSKDDALKGGSTGQFVLVAAATAGPRLKVGPIVIGVDAQLATTQPDFEATTPSGSVSFGKVGIGGELVIERVF